MNAVMSDEQAAGVSSFRHNYIVMTGCWRMIDGDDGVPHILATDNYSSPENVLDVVLADDCEVIDGEVLLMYTRVLLDDREFSLVVIKSQVYAPGETAEAE